jgi:tRNA uridine 5-carbamoylmethylation protein Kti12
MTKVINLYGGPSSGKSTTAAGIYHALKNHNIKAELVREYVKSWAWEGKIIGKWDQPYILAKQMREEARLYGKVDYIITDSPLWIACYYNDKYSPGLKLRELVLSFYAEAEKAGVIHTNYLLTRTKPYEQAGRYESEQEAKQVDFEQAAFLTEVGAKWTNTKGPKLVELITADKNYFR